MERRRFVKIGAIMAAAAMPAYAGESLASSGAKPGRFPTIFDFGAVGDGATDDSPAFTKALREAAARGVVVIVPSGHYAIAKPISFVSARPVAQSWGLLCQGATLISQINSGEDVISLTARHSLQYFRLTGGLSIWGGGSSGRHDGNGLRIFAPGGGTSAFFNFVIEGLSVSQAGGHGLLLEGNVFEASIVNSYFQGCGKNGATFACSKGGICSAINIVGSFFVLNDKYGLSATNFDSPYGGTTDVRVYGGYCRDNRSYGFYYNNGTNNSVIDQVGFENNCTALSPGDPEGAHVYGTTSMKLRDCNGFNMYGGATYLLRGWFDAFTHLDGCVQRAGGPMAGTGKSRLVQVNGNGDGHVLLTGCDGGVEVVAGQACTWEARNCSGPSPLGPLSPRRSLSSVS